MAETTNDTQTDLFYLSDGAYANFVTGLGDPRMDKDEHTRIVCGVSLPNYDALAAQYVKDGVVKKIARGPAVKALKTPIVINDDKEDKTYKALSRLGFFRACRNAGTWARLFGGALVVTLFEGEEEGKLEEEVSKSAKVAGYRVYTPGRIMLTESDICNDVKSPWFGKIERFPVQVRNGSIVHIHASRCHIFKGVDAPDLMDPDIRTYIFGASEIDMANVGIKKLPPAFGAISNMLQENGLSVFSMNGFSQMLAQKDGMQKARERMSLVKIGMSTMRAVFQDKEDSYEMKSHSMGDVPESVKMLMAYLSGLTDIPVSILFGNMVSGLSSTNDGDIRQYNDMVEQWRNDCLYEPMVEMLTEFRNRNEGKQGIQDFTFGELSQSTESEKADLFEKRVNSCKTLYEMGSMTPKEARKNLLVNGGTSELSVEGDDVPVQQQPAPTAQANAE